MGIYSQEGPKHLWLHNHAVTVLVSVVAQLREERTNLIHNLKHVDAALSVLGKLNGGKTSRGTAPDAFGVRP
jgi:hypothetical protein